MQIKTISATVKHTYNLGNYSNVSPSVTVTADLDGDCNGDEIEQLREIARAEVHAEIDEALENQGNRPEFYSGPRYALIANPHDELAVIVPDEQVDELPDPWRKYSRHMRDSWGGRRLERIWQRIEDRHHDWQVFDCSRGLDDSQSDKLPHLQWLTVFEDRHAETIVIMPGRIDDQPDWLTECLGPSERSRLKANLLADYAKHHPGWTIIDAEIQPVPTFNRLAVFCSYDLDSAIIAQPDVTIDDLPEAWRLNSLQKFIRGTWGDVWEKVGELDLGGGKPFIDCTDGDFSRLDADPPEIDDEDDNYDEDEWYEGDDLPLDEEIQF